MPWAEVPAFYARLKAKEVRPDAGEALALAVITGVRSGEAARTNYGRAHAVPLSPQAVEVPRRRATEGRAGVLCPARRAGAPDSGSRLTTSLSWRMGVYGGMGGAGQSRVKP